MLQKAKRAVPEGLPDSNRLKNGIYLCTHGLERWYETLIFQTKRCVHLYNRRPLILRKNERYLSNMIKDKWPRTSLPVS